MSRRTIVRVVTGTATRATFPHFDINKTKVTLEVTMPDKKATARLW